MDFRRSFDMLVAIAREQLGLDPRQYLLDTLEALRTTPHRELLSLSPRAYAERRRALAAAV